MPLSDIGFQSAERYRLLVEALGDYAICMLDASGYIESWNFGASRLTGLSPEEALGRHYTSLRGAAFDRQHDPALSIAAAKGWYGTEGWRERKDGSRFFAHASIYPIKAGDGRVIGFAKVLRDLTEERAAKEALRRSEEQFGLLVNAVTDYAIYMLDAEGVITTWNPGAERAKGYAAAEAIGSHFSRFYLPQDRDAGVPKQGLAKALQHGRFEQEGWRVRKDGSRFWANVVIDPVLDSDGQVVGFAKVTRDITEKRNAQMALEQAREALFQTRKLDAIGQLTGGVAHDFNNLLMVVLTSLELIRKKMPDDARLRQLVDNAVLGARRGVTLTQRMLAFARRQELQPTPLELQRLMTEMQDMIQSSVGPRVQVDLQVAEELPQVLADRNQLELALLNLAVNARDAMPEGGAFMVSAREVSVEPGHKLKPGRYIVISARDNGCGMPPETLARAMEPFFTTKGVGKGTGLGLAMVHGLAEQLGGGFLLDSAPGQGTEASLWLPVAQAEAQTLAKVVAPPVAPLAAARPAKVLLVDDDMLVLAGTRSMLEELGHTVRSVASGREALDLVEAGEQFDLLLTDQVMPGMSGSSLLQAVRALRPTLPAILASGYVELPALVDGFTLRLAKPFDQTQLAVAVAAAFRGTAS